MPIDVDRALTAEPRTADLSWREKDVLLYHFGVGAGRPATDPAELRYVLEDRLRVLPSFATVAGGAMDWWDAVSAPGVDVDLAAVLHGAQRLTLHRPLPARGDVERRSEVTAVHDKGGAAVVVLRSEAADAEGPLWSGEAQVFVRGEGGFGGDRGPSGRLPDPAGPPVRVLECATREDQALLYRLSGDRNPLHAEPEFARRAGFERPILHGLCSYGMVLKAVVDGELDGGVSRVRDYAVRFTGIVLPGETLRVSVWHDGPGRLRVAAAAAERADAPVLSGTLQVGG